MKKLSMLFLFISSVLLLVSIRLPWWGMVFHAPQYPEGLKIIVYPSKMAGQMDIINSLNHYIGMKQFSEASFPELHYLSYIIVGFAILILLATLIRKRFGIYVVTFLFMLGGAVGIWDIHRWLSKYGTELDPKAPIKIPPFVPPVIGSNRIANFTTESYFTYGSYVIGIAFIFIILALWCELKKEKIKELK